jgi:hypothetical protein
LFNNSHNRIIDKDRFSFILAIIIGLVPEARSLSQPDSERVSPIIHQKSDRPSYIRGTIVGWEQVTPSAWLENLSLSSNEWLHLLFEIGGNNKIEAVCRSLVIEQLATQPLALSS